jgi:hypothetical protein
MLRSIQEFLGKINTFLYERLNLADFIGIIGVILITSFSLLLFMYTEQKTYTETTYLEGGNDVRSKKAIIFGSKTSDIYFYTWCKGAEKIKNENKIWFESEDDALRAGRRLSLTCTQ